MTAATSTEWAAARQAVAGTATRVTAMLRSARRPDAVALGEWTVRQVAIHLSLVCDAVWAMSRGGGNLITDLWDLSTLNRVMVEGEGPRPLGEMADRIDATVAGFLSAMEVAEEDSCHSWLVQGTEMPLSSLTCHVLSELTVHGRDIAQVEGVPWPIDRGHAALIVDKFVVPSLHTLGRSIVDQEAAGRARARFELRLRGDGRSWLRFHDGDFAVESSPQGPVDCHLSVDPVAFLLVSWGRISQWQAIPKGQLLAWGRKPWLGLQLRSWLRNP